jgi:FKBP-type peptidyl-prolyl cis-trans isomerase
MIGGLLPAVALWFSSCSHSKYSDYEKTASGLQYKFHIKGKDTIHPKYGEIVKVKLAKKLGDSVLESTNLLGNDGIDQLLREPTFKGGIEEGIRLMTIGDSATFLLSTDSINKYFPQRDSTKRLKKNDFMAFGIKLMQIKTMAQVQKEDNDRRQAYIQSRKEKGPQELSRYIHDNHIEAKPSATGLYLIETEKGKGASPKDGDTVVVHYTGSFLNGTVFDSSVKRNQPFKFAIGAKQVILGWDEALKLMKKGEVATIIIPSSLAYDSVGYINQQTGKYFIPPYMPMKFDIQLLEIKSKKINHL